MTVSVFALFFERRSYFANVFLVKSGFHFEGVAVFAPLTPALSPLRGEGDAQCVRLIAGQATPSPLNGERAGVRGAADKGLLIVR